MNVKYCVDFEYYDSRDDYLDGIAILDNIMFDDLESAFVVALGYAVNHLKFDGDRVTVTAWDEDLEEEIAIFIEYQVVEGYIYLIKGSNIGEVHFEE